MYLPALNCTVLATSDAALEGCLRLRLPCYNSIPVVHGDAGTGNAYIDGCWRRIIAMRDLLQVLPTGTHLHWTDPDVVRSYSSRVLYTAHTTVYILFLYFV